MNCQPSSAKSSAAVAALLEIGRQKAAAFCAPRNVTIVGASDRPGSWGGMVMKNLLKAGFDKPVLLINPQRSEVAGIRCYPDFASLPEPPDQVVLLVPGPKVPEILAEAGAAGARTALVMAGGFGEGAASADGIALRDQLEAALASSDIALCGPNCMGAFVAKSRLATMTAMPEITTPGPIALVGQSGGVVLHLSTTLAQRGIWASHIISSGNEISLTTADYIAHLATEPDVRVIFTYTESIRDIAKFIAACRLARDAGKSIVAFRIGQSESGREAALAHTGSLAGSTAMFDAIAGAEGVMRADSMDEAVQLIELLVNSGIPAGRRLGVVTLSGAIRGVVLDAAARAGLTTPALTEQTMDRLRKTMLPDSPVGNPLDGGFSVMSSNEAMLNCVEAMADDPNIDCVVAQADWAPQLANSPIGSSMKAIAEFATKRSPKSVAFIAMMTQSETDYTRQLRRELGAISFLQEPNSAFSAISKAVRSRELLALANEPDGMPTRAPVLPEHWDDKAGALDEAASKALISAYGIPILGEEIVSTAEQAVAAAKRLGYPVVMKVASEAITHKSDVGGVALDLRDGEAVREAFARITDDVADHGFVAERMLVAPMVRGGVEIALGVINDPEMGVGIMVSSGGVLLELNPDAVFAAAPVSRSRALDMLQQIKAWRLLQGYRGEGPADIDAVVKSIVALGKLAADIGPQIDAIDINPLIARNQGQGAVALDALVVVRHAVSRRPEIHIDSIRKSDEQ